MGQISAKIQKGYKEVHIFLSFNHYFEHLGSLQDKTKLPLGVILSVAPGSDNILAEALVGDLRGGF